MQRLVGLAELERAVGSKGLVLFPIVRELRFYEADQGVETIQCVDMTLASDELQRQLQLRLTFSRVSELQISNFGGGQTRIIGFDIQDISGRHWERINWLVSDYENGVLRFFCETAKIVSIDHLDEE